MSGDAVCLADGFVYFLSLRGLCKWGGSGQPELLNGLGSEWLDSLSPAQLEWASIAQDPYNGEIVISVTGTGLTENSYEYSFDPSTGAFWPDYHTHPGLFLQTRDSTGRPVLLYTHGKYIIQRSRGTNDLVPSGTVSGTVTSSSSLSMTDSTASFFTTGGGLAEAYVHFFHPTTMAHLASRRIYSNTGTALTWAGSGAGSGVYTAAAGTVYQVGSIYWYWKTPVMEVPAHAHSSLSAHIGVNPESGRYLYLTETTNGVDKAVKSLHANKHFEQFSTLQHGQTMQLKIESRDCNSTVSIRNISLEREVRGGTQ